LLLLSFPAMCFKVWMPWKRKRPGAGTGPSFVALYALCFPWSTNYEHSLFILSTGLRQMSIFRTRDESGSGRCVLCGGKRQFLFQEDGIDLAAFLSGAAAQRLVFSLEHGVLFHFHLIIAFQEQEYG